MDRKLTTGEIYRLLKTADINTAWGHAIHTALDSNVPVSKVLEQIREQYQDCPEIMRSCFNDIEKILV